MGQTKPMLHLLTLKQTRNKRFSDLLTLNNVQKQNNFLRIRLKIGYR